MDVAAAFECGNVLLSSSPLLCGPVLWLSFVVVIFWRRYKRLILLLFPFVDDFCTDRSRKIEIICAFEGPLPSQTRAERAKTHHTIRRTTKNRANQTEQTNKPPAVRDETE